MFVLLSLFAAVANAIDANIPLFKEEEARKAAETAGPGVATRLPGERAAKQVIKLC